MGPTASEPHPSPPRLHGPRRPVRRHRLTVTGADALGEHLAAHARAAAEIALLELDALLIGPRRYPRTRRQLRARCAAMLDGWRAAAAERGVAAHPCIEAAAERGEAAFRDRVRELRAAAAPGGHA